MTWQASFQVEDVGDGPAPIDVLATAVEGSIISNTEGPIRAIEIKFQIDADETKVAIGDQFVVSGHFMG